MADSRAQGAGSCPCGTGRFSITGKPVLRFYCHCTICQAFNQADRADVTVFHAKDVALQDPATVGARFGHDGRDDHGTQARAQAVFVSADAVVEVSHGWEAGRDPGTATAARKG